MRAVPQSVGDRIRSSAAFAQIRSIRSEAGVSNLRYKVRLRDAMANDMMRAKYCKTDTSSGCRDR